MKLNIVPTIGERALLVGQTGSGKTAFVVWLLQFLPWGVVYDTKIEPKFASLPGAEIVDDWNDVTKVVRDPEKRFAVFRPPVGDTTDPDALDAYLQLHYQQLRGAVAFIDETYMFCNGGRAGPGLTGLLTRGRSRGITTIMATQRPAWLTRFAITESQRFYIFRLVDERDRATLDSVIPFLGEYPAPPKYHCFYYEFDLERPVLLNPVPIDVSNSASYTDGTEETRKAWI